MTRGVCIPIVLSLAVLYCPSLPGETLHFVLKTGSQPLLPTLLSIDLEGLPLPDDAGRIALYRIDGERRIPLPCQVEFGHSARLWFIQDVEIPPKSTVLYEVAPGESRDSGTPLTASMDTRAISLSHEGRKILRYQAATHDVPKGVDPIHRRSGFIHPLWSPQGKRLTRIQPPDHHHHYGIWNPWTKVLINGQKVDFWNLGKAQGTVRFAGLLATCSGPVFCGFKVKQDHVVLQKGGAEQGEKVAIHEMWDVRASRLPVSGQDTWLIDVTIHLCNALERDIELSKYRYGGGLGFRATEAWQKGNCSVLTSEGKTRKDADNSRARWCDVRGGEGTTAGIVFMSHISNRGHPEPMRVWPENVVKGKGYLYFGFTPTRHRSWILEPHREYVLRYRLCVHDGTMDPVRAEQLWRAFSLPPRIEVKQ